MISSRLASSGMAVAVMFAFAQPAFAATSDEILERQASFQTDDLCAGKTGALRGRCIGDVLKRIRTLRKEFQDALEIERDAWKKEHSDLGASSEYRKSLQLYTKEVSTKRTLFNTQQRLIEKKFFDEQKAIRSRASSTTSPGITREINTDDMEEARQQCSRFKSSSALRVCLRRQLRLITVTPQVRQPVHTEE